MPILLMGHCYSTINKEVGEMGGTISMETPCDKAESINSNGPLDSKNERSPGMLESHIPNRLCLSDLMIIRKQAVFMMKHDNILLDHSRTSLRR